MFRGGVPWETRRSIVRSYPSAFEQTILRASGPTDAYYVRACIYTGVPARCMRCPRVHGPVHVYMYNREYMHRYGRACIQGMANASAFTHSRYIRGEVRCALLDFPGFSRGCGRAVDGVVVGGGGV